MKAISVLVLLLFLTQSHSQTKFQKWQKDSYFRGYNILYESPKNLQDFIDFRNYGGNLFHIGTWGFLSEDPPYDTVQSNIEGTDRLVEFCRETGIYYVIAVRSGPGAYDTYQESSGMKPESRIWENFIEQTLYADMLKSIVNRYKDDTLFAGINLLVEPRPKVKFIPANNSQLYKFFLENIYRIHMDQVYELWIEQIRTVSPDIPVILENFGYSTAELFPAYTVSDANIIYSTHLYMPKEFTNAEISFSMEYPGTYWNLTYLSQKLYNEEFIKETILSKVRAFQEETGKPVLLGEFGMFRPQNGGDQYIDDVLGTCVNYGWHFALWDWRRGSGENWNIEGFSGDNSAHWKAVLSKFNAPPVPTVISPAEYEYFTDVIDFEWEKLTDFTLYDIQIMQSDSIIFELNDIKDFSYKYMNGNLEEGIEYTWRMRSKNPGGKEANASAWTDERTIYKPVPDKPVLSHNELNGNYPNPFNPSTSINYEIALAGNVGIIIYNIAGQIIEVLENSFKNKGSYNVIWNAQNFSSGIYFYRLTVTGGDGETYRSETKRMLLLK